MEYVILILVFIILSLVYAVYNLLSKVERYEDFIDQQELNNQTLLETLRRIDSKQMFEKDDEVGSLFVQLKDIITQFKQF
jgi:cell division protein FtsL